MHLGEVAADLFLGRPAGRQADRQPGNGRARTVDDGEVFLEGEALSASGHALEFLKDQYRHCKPILLLDGADVLLEKAGIPPALASGDPDPGLMRFENSDVAGAVAAFVAALTKHRQFDRETDPPRV
jgi:catalase